MISNSADEVCVPLVRSDTFINEEERFRVIFLLDRSELIVVTAEKRFLPIEFVSRTLYATKSKKMELSWGIVDGRGIVLPR